MSLEYFGMGKTVSECLFLLLMRYVEPLIFSKPLPAIQRLPSYSDHLQNLKRKDCCQLALAEAMLAAVASRTGEATVSENGMASALEEKPRKLHRALLDLRLMGYLRFTPPGDCNEKFSISVDWDLIEEDWFYRRPEPRRHCFDRADGSG
jgi:hypothetical protein